MQNEIARTKTIGWRVEIYGGRRHRTNIEITVALRDRHHDCETVDHDHVTKMVELSITGTERAVRLDGGRLGNRSDDGFESGGQIDMHALSEGRTVPWGITEWAEGWDTDQARELLAIWDRWHLNTMKPGCAHQVPVMEFDRYGREVASLTLTPACPETGYRYGHAWLAEQVPEDVLAWLRNRFDLPLTAIEAAEEATATMLARTETEETRRAVDQAVRDSLREAGEI